MKLKIYYVIETFARGKDDEWSEYIAGPFRSWEAAFDYRYGTLPGFGGDLDVVEQDIEVTEC